jgi:hypothetical protein
VLSRFGKRIWWALSTASVIYWLASLFGATVLAIIGTLVSYVADVDLPLIWSLVLLGALAALGGTVTIVALQARYPTAGFTDRANRDERENAPDNSQVSMAIVEAVRTPAAPPTAQEVAHEQLAAGGRIRHRLTRWTTPTGH